MKVFDTYLITLTSAFVGTFVGLALFNQHHLDLYLSFFFIEYLIVTMLFTYIHPRAYKLLNITAYLFFTGFIGIILIRLVPIVDFAQLATIFESTTARYER